MSKNQNYLSESLVAIERREALRDRLESALEESGIRNEVGVPSEVVADFLVGVIGAAAETFSIWVNPQIEMPKEQAFHDFYLNKLGDPGTYAVALKIGEEAQEVMDELKSPSPSLSALIGEIADVVISALVTAESLGVRPRDIFNAVDEKMARNMARTWAKQEDGSIHHTNKENN